MRPVNRSTAPGSPATWALPASYPAAAVIGLAWAAILRARRPAVYATIGLGPHAITGQRALPFCLREKAGRVDMAERGLAPIGAPDEP